MTKLIQITGVTLLVLIGSLMCAQAFSLFPFQLGFMKNNVSYVDLLVNPAWSGSCAAGSHATGTNTDMVLTLTNSGNDTLEQGTITAGNAPFSLLSTTCGTAPFNLAAGANCTATVRFSPTEAGDFTGTLRLAAPNLTNLDLGCTGTGTCTAQTITWNSQPAAMTVGDADQTLDMASASSGLAVTYTTSTTDYCTVVAGALHAVAAGTCVVHADQAGNGTYCAASQVDSGDVTISGNTVDASRGFEVSLPTGWATTDIESQITEESTAQAHSGTKSMAITGGSTTVAYQRYDTGATRSAASFAFWYYAPSSTGGDDSGVIIATFGAASPGTYGINIYFGKTSGTYHFRARGTSFPAGVASITPGAWYRVECNYVQNSTSTVTIYNAAGATLDTISITANNNASRYLYLGKTGTNATTSWTTAYWDDWGIDYTDSTTPLWPFTVGN